MLPIITGLNKAANDGGSLEQSLDKVMVHATARATNDVEDMYAKTMDRIIARHNGHNSRYRDNKGRFTSINNKASNDRVDAYEKTMDRIMARHNGHGTSKQASNQPDAYEKTMDRIMMRHNGHDEEKTDAANDRRIIGDYFNSVPQATSRPRVLPLDKKMRTMVLRNEAQEEGGVSSGSRVMNILTSIDKNVQMIAKRLEDRDDGEGIGSLRAREMDIENQQGTGPFSKKSILDMARARAEDDKISNKIGRAQALLEAGSSLKTAAILGAVGLGGKVLGHFLPHTDTGDGKGVGQQQKNNQRSDAENRPSAKEPQAAPRPDAIPSMRGDVKVSGTGTTNQNKARLAQHLKKSGNFTDAEISQIMGQAEAESGFKPRSENLHYSASTLTKLFGKKVSKSGRSAESIVAGGEEAIGNFIYGGRMGNKANEGFKYRGRGMIQLTGKKQYELYGKALSIDLVNNPDLANDPEVASLIVGEYFKQRKKEGANISTAAGATRAVAPAGWQSQISKRGQLASKYDKNTIDSLMGMDVGSSGAKHGPSRAIPVDAKWNFEDDQNKNENLLKQMKGVKKGQTKILTDGSTYQGGNSVTINLAPASSPPQQMMQKPTTSMEKKRVPSPRSMSWEDYKKYFAH